MKIKFSPFLNQKYLSFLTFLFFLSRTPLLKNHFFHCDDSARLATYPLFSKSIGYLNWYVSELIHYKLFLKTPSFVFENTLSRSFSMLMSFFSLYVLLMIIKKLFNNDYLTLFMGVIMCCSQMSMIYSIHSGPYGYSTLSLGFMILYILIMNNYNRKSRGFNLLIFSVIICPLIDIFSISIAPVFILIILLDFNSGNIKLNLSKSNILTSLGLILSSLFVLLFQIVPLKKEMNRPMAINWNTGINNQFFLNKNSFYDFILNPLEPIWFYLKNLMLVFENNLSPIGSFNSNLETPIAIFGALLFLPILIIGAFGLKKINFKLFLFLILNLICFFSLIYFNLLVLSPTRHNLWLNIIFIILIATSARKLNTNVLILLSVIIGFGTVTSYSSFFKKREAKITYNILKKLDSRFEIDYFIDYTIYSKGWFTTSQNISKLFIKKNLRAFKENHNSLDSSLVFCLINHRPIDGLKNENIISQKMNLQTVLVNNDVKKSIKSEKTLYEKYIFSQTEFGRSKYCSNGTNGSFFKIIKAKLE